MNALFLLVCAAFQAPSPAAGQEQRAALLDRVVFIVNEDIVTQRGYQRELQAIYRDSPPQTEEDRRRANAQLQQRLLEQFTGHQAGETLGYDPQMITRYVRDYEERFIERLGGVDRMAEYMAQRQITIQDLRAELRMRVYRDLWEDSITGSGVSSKNRVTVDRWLRPGLLRLQHDLALSTRGGAEALGGTPQRVVLRILEVDPLRVGGVGAAGQAAARIRERIANGEDFETLVREYAVDGTPLGNREALDEQGIEAQDPTLGRALRGTAEGTLLPPIPPANANGRWRIVRLERRIAASVPPFLDRSLQASLRRNISENLDLQRLARARAEQYAGSYIWPKSTPAAPAPR